MEAVLFLHLLWCAWVLLGWTVTRNRPVLRTLHIASLIYAIVVESVPWLPCPLTLAETSLEARAGIEPRMVKKLEWIEMAQLAVSSILFKSLSLKLP